MKQTAEKKPGRKTKAVKKAPKSPFAAIPKSVRADGERQTYYVFQNESFEHASAGGYIWAPVKNKTGDTFHYWDRLCDLREGDVLFHGALGELAALSVVKGSCFSSVQPQDNAPDGSGGKLGRRVDCHYVLLKSPVKTASYKTEIIELVGSKYEPFDKDGNDNPGYLYELSPQLAKVFIDGLLRSNPSLSNAAFIKDLLEMM